MRSRISRRTALQAFGGLGLGLNFGISDSHAHAKKEEKKLNLYNWSTYIGETTLVDFTAATGIEVRMDIFADNADLFAKLKVGNPGYDVIIPSDSWVPRMVGANMLMPLDKSKIPNIANIDPMFRDASFDRDRKYTLPYMWGTIGIGYRKSKTISGPPDSWKYLYDSDQYSGHISLLSDARHVIGFALIYLGFSMNSVNEQELKKAEELVIAQKENIKTFAPDNGQDLLASGECDLVMEYNGDIGQLMAKDDDIDYIIPKEGGQVWQDTMAIPAGAPHPENAHSFMNFILDGKVSSLIAQTIQYATPNVAGRALMDDGYAKKPVIFPNKEDLKRCQVQEYLGEDGERLYAEAWTRIQAA